MMTMIECNLPAMCQQRGSDQVKNTRTYGPSSIEVLAITTSVNHVLSCCNLHDTTMRPNRKRPKVARLKRPATSSRD